MSVTSSLVGGVSFDAFDPNVDSKQQPTWGIFNGIRFRTYARNQRGHAINAFHQAHSCKFYEFDNGRWILRGVKKGRPETCDRCLGSTSVPRKRYNYQTNQRETVPDQFHNAGRWEWTRRKGKIVDPMSLGFYCHDCAELVRHS